VRVHSAAPLVVRLIVVHLIVVLILVPAAVVAEEVSRPAGLNGTASVSVNAGPCVYDTVAEAMANASDGDTIVIRPGFRAEFIGKIDLNVTLIQGGPISPGNTGCELPGVSADPTNLTFDAKTFSNDDDGGMAEVLADRTVAFRNMTLRQAFAKRGGLLAIQEGADVTLRRVVLELGTASEAGGLIYAAGTALNPVSLDIDGRFLGALREGSSAGMGGAIHAEHTNLTLVDVEFLNNQAEGEGGGVSINAGSLEAHGTEFIDNSSLASGGAIFAVDLESLLINETEFNSNGAAVNGGAAAIEEVTTTVINNDTVFFDNAADGLGGAIHYASDVIDYTLAIERTLFDDNISGFGGGATWMRGGDIKIGVQTEFVNNRANQGGAVLLDQTLGRVHIDRATFQFNEAFEIGGNPGDGGALFFEDVADLIIENTVIDQNEAENGGGIFAIGSVFSTNSLELINVAVSANRARESGGGIFTQQLDLLMSQSVVASNISDGSGGGLFLLNSSTILDGIIVEANTANSSGGGGMRISGGSARIENGSSILNNRAEGSLRFGGGIRALTQAQLSITDTLIRGNQSEVGGGISGFNSAIEVINSQIENNSASSRGGGVNVNSTALFIRSDVGSESGQCIPASLPINRYCMEITGNSSQGAGGGLFIQNTSGAQIAEPTVISGVAILNNQAFDGGAAIFADYSVPETLQLQNLLIFDHGSADVSVVEILGDTDARLHALTIAGNSGPGLQATDNATTLELSASIIFDNALAPNVAFGVLFTRSCNNSQPGSGQSMGGNLGNPGFVTTARGDYRLDANSASADQCESGPGRDLDGLYRLSGSLIDQGAFEHDGLLVPPDSIFGDRFLESTAGQ